MFTSSWMNRKRRFQPPSRFFFINTHTHSCRRGMARWVHLDFKKMHVLCLIIHWLASFTGGHLSVPNSKWPGNVSKVHRVLRKSFSFVWYRMTRTVCKRPRLMIFYLSIVFSYLLFFWERDRIFAFHLCGVRYKIGPFQNLSFILVNFCLVWVICRLLLI